MMTMPTCKEVTAAVASENLAGRPWRQRLMARLHLIMCRHCRRYVAQLAAIGDAARRLYRRQPRPSDALERSILDSLRKR